MKSLTDLYLTTEDLAERWQMTVHALDQWRWQGHGPRFLKFGKRILYDEEEIARFEAEITETPDADVNDPCFACIKLDKK